MTNAEIASKLTRPTATKRQTKRRERERVRGEVNEVTLMYRTLYLGIRKT